MGAIGEIIGTVSQFVPTWLLAIIGLALVIALGPGWVTGLRIKRVKALLRKTVRAGGSERLNLQQQALDLALGRGEVLLALVREADKLNQPRLRDRALKKLARLGTHADEVRKLSKPTDPGRDRQIGHPVEAAVLVERLLENGAIEAAREKLREARRRFPDDADLASLDQRIHGIEDPP